MGHHQVSGYQDFISLKVFLQGFYKIMQENSKFL